MINGFFVSPDFCKSIGNSCEKCNNQGCLSREKISNFETCKHMGTCWKVIAYFNGDNKYMCCCDNCEDYEEDCESS